jgi:hypothetical protein
MTEAATTEEDWTCPGCGLPDEELPVGHCLSTPMDGSAPSCSVITNTVSPEKFIAAGVKPAWLRNGGPVFLGNMQGPAFPPVPERSRDYLEPPEALGGFMHSMLGGTPQPGPPYTHTLVPPEPIGEDEDGNDIYPPPGPSFTMRGSKDADG